MPEAELRQTACTYEYRTKELYEASKGMEARDIDPSVKLRELTLITRDFEACERGRKTTSELMVRKDYQPDPAQCARLFPKTAPPQSDTTK